MFCRKCGKEIADDSTFCNKCGSPVAEEKPVQANSKLWDYNNALKKLKTAKTIEEFDEIESTFKLLGDYKDSAEQAEKCRENRIPIIYEKTLELIDSVNGAENLETAIKNLKSLNGYKDSNELLEQCEYDLKLWKYNDAFKLMNSAKTADEFTKAQQDFISLGDFEDASDLAVQCKESANEHIYMEAKNLMDNAKSPADLALASSKFRSIEGYKNSSELTQKCYNSTAEDVYGSALSKMKSAQQNLSADDYDQAGKLFESVKLYLNSEELWRKCEHNKKTLIYNKTIDKLRASSNANDISKCAEEFSALGDFMEAKKMPEECSRKIRNIDAVNDYKKALITFEQSSDIDDLQSARNKLIALGDALNAAELAEECSQKIEHIRKEAFYNAPYKAPDRNRTVTAMTDSIYYPEKAELKLYSFSADVKVKGKVEDKYQNKPEPQPENIGEPVAFCRKCGAKLYSETIGFCPHCNTQII